MKFLLILLVIAAIVFLVVWVRSRKSKRALKVTDAKQAVQTKRSAALHYPEPSSSQVYGSTYRSKSAPASKPSVAPKPYKPAKSRARDEDDTVYGGYVEDTSYYAGADDYSRPNYTEPTYNSPAPNYESGPSTPPSSASDSSNTGSSGGYSD